MLRPPPTSTLFPYTTLFRSYRAAISVGTNPHYGGSERRIEPHLLDFEGDLYGQRLVVRSEEHTSELQSRLHLVCRLLLEKKKQKHAQKRMSYTKITPT